MHKYLILGFVIMISSCAFFNTETKYDVGQIITPKGEMLFWLHEDTPVHKESFIKLAAAHYWDTLHFNRVIEDFVIQGGCPDTPEGFADSPYLLEPEFRDTIKHIYGAVGAGRDGNEAKLSAGCQLYIVDNEKGIPRLDGDYMIFGQVFKGMDVLDAIAKVATDTLDQPLERVSMKVNAIKMNAKELLEAGYSGGLSLR